ncbi:MAG: nucleotide exchange factor GrpE [bacterium]|nr:nucleotide exchange factor GrpE [bacterium]
MAKKKKTKTETENETIVNEDSQASEEASENNSVEGDMPEPLELDMDQLQAAINDAKSTQQNSKDEVLRVRAEFENFKRRKEQEKEEFMKYANEKVILEILPALDSFDMAIAQADSTDNKDVKNVIVGFQYIHQQLTSALEKQGVTRIESLGKEFDPKLHQAMGKEAVEGKEKDTVVKQLQAGYSLNGRVIRPAMVMLAE